MIGLQDTRGRTSSSLKSNQGAASTPVTREGEGFVEWSSKERRLSSAPGEKGKSREKAIPQEGENA